MRLFKAKWLFENHKTYVSRIQVLNYLLEHTDQERLSDDTLIEMIVYHKTEAPGSAGNKGSNTEYAALTLEEKKKELELDIQKRSSEWMKELQQLELYMNLYDAAQKALTEEEHMLAELYYENGYTIEEITQFPLTSRTGGLKSRSTISRMLRIIEEKVSIVIDMESRMI